MRAPFKRYVVSCFAVAALAATASAQTRYTTIVIDPGHGGFDRGGIPGQRVPEKIMTLDVSLRLKTAFGKGRLQGNHDAKH
jgi:N-acetylmuramoyl-L-alanine amidase